MPSGPCNVLSCFAHHGRAGAAGGAGATPPATAGRRWSDPDAHGVGNRELWPSHPRLVLAHFCCKRANTRNP